MSLAECFLPLLTYSTHKIRSSFLASSLTDSVSRDDDNDDDDDDDEDTDDDDKEEDSKEEEEDEEVDEITNDNNEDNIMPPKLKEKTPKKGNSNSPKKEKHPAGVEKLASSTKKLNITEPSLKSFSMVTLDGYMVKKYCQKFADFVEVDFHVAGVLAIHAYKVELSPDGLIMIWRRAIPAYFFESKRMASMLGRNFNPDESRIIAHDDVVQQIRNGGTENNGLHFAPEEDAMVVQLGVVCTGTVRVKETLNKVDEIVHAGKTHNQYNTIFSCRVKVMKERTVQKRQARRAVLDDDIGAISEEDDTDGDDDDDDEEMLGAVGSGQVGR